MKRFLSIAVISALPLVATAEVQVYGRANVSLQRSEVNDESINELASNASRIGVKGDAAISESLKGTYRMEFEVQVDDGDKDGQTFSQRNIYAGLEGSAGQVIAGKFDTPLRTVQNKVDLFNDLPGDIKNTVTDSENRASNSVMFTTPVSWGPVKASFDLILSEEEKVDDGVSLSFAYDSEGIYVGAAYDKDVVDVSVEVVRLVGQFNFSGFQLGLLAENQDPKDSTLNKGDGYLVSLQYKTSDKIALKAQYGQSDIVRKGAYTTSIGIDYRMSDQTRTYAFFTNNDSDESSKDEYFGVGFEIRF